MIESYDVVVSGGGPAGVAAAIAAARNGAKTLLLERYGFLGGMGTAGLVAPFMQYATDDQVLVRGVFEEITNRMEAMGCYDRDNNSFQAEALKYVLNELCTESGVKLRFHVFVCGADCRNGFVRTVEYVGKAGKTCVAAKVFIDATGDADLSALCGCEFAVGRDGDGCCQPATLMCRLGGVSSEATLQKGVERAVPEEHELPQGRILYFKLPYDGQVVLNMTRVTNLNALDTDDLTRAELESRRQVFQVIDYMRANVKGFEKAYLLDTATQIGIRESRRVIGDYLLTQEHIFSYRKSPFDIAYCSYKIDIHNPTGSGTEIRELTQGQYYGVPYGCLVPKGIENLLVAGRPISSTHEAHSSVRIMPTCYATGEAAGTAAALAALESGKTRDVDVRQLRNHLQLPAEK